MPRYRFHLYNDVESKDLVGREFADISAARADAIGNARSVMAADIVEKGEITLSHRIELEAEDGELHVIEFRDAVTINQ